MLHSSPVTFDCSTIYDPRRRVAIDYEPVVVQVPNRSAAFPESSTFWHEYVGAPYCEGGLFEEDNPVDQDSYLSLLDSDVLEG